MSHNCCIRDPQWGKGRAVIKATPPKQPSPSLLSLLFVQPLSDKSGLSHELPWSPSDAQVSLCPRGTSPGNPWAGNHPAGHSTRSFRPSQQLSEQCLMLLTPLPTHWFSPITIHCLTRQQRSLGEVTLGLLFLASGFICVMGTSRRNFKASR